MKFGNHKFGVVLVALVTASIAGCGSVEKLDLRKQGGSSSDDSTALTGKNSSTTDAQSEPAKGTPGPSTTVSHNGKDDSRYPTGNVCTLSRKKLETAGILAQAGQFVPIGEFSLAQSPSSQGDSSVEPPSAETEVIDGIEYQIFYTTEATCKTRSKGIGFDFSGEQSSLHLQESLYNAMCQKGPQPLSDAPAGNQIKPNRPTSNPLFSAKNYWRAFETRKCVENRLKHYVDAAGNEVVFGQSGSSEPVSN